jgi:hypothetical protein
MESPANTGGKVFTGRCRSDKIRFRSGWQIVSFTSMAAIKSLPTIFRRIANPVDPFGFTLIQDQSVLPLLAGIGDGFWHNANLFDQPAEGSAKVFQSVQSDFPAPFDRRPRRR